MKLRTLCISAAALGMMGGVSLAAETKPSVPKVPASAKSKPVEMTTDTSIVANQKLAEAVAARLTSSNVSEGADVSIVTENGTVTVSGPCRTATQKTAILQEVRVVTGVKMVRDGLTVGMGIQQAQATGPGGMPPMNPMNMGPLVEPAPLGMPGGAMGDTNAPSLPPYAWPTYAPHNNVSRVGYPTAYPYNAFPFIGPFYPFPKVPLGWRSVSMTWEDGHWWYGRTSTPQDYWRVRFW
jgi:hypothetical protein